MSSAQLSKSKTNWNRNKQGCTSERTKSSTCGTLRTLASITGTCSSRWCSYSPAWWLQHEWPSFWWTLSPGSWLIKLSIFASSSISSWYLTVLPMTRTSTSFKTVKQLLHDICSLGLWSTSWASSPSTWSCRQAAATWTTWSELSALGECTNFSNWLGCWRCWSWSRIEVKSWSTWTRLWKLGLALKGYSSSSCSFSWWVISSLACGCSQPPSMKPKTGLGWKNWKAWMSWNSISLHFISRLRP